METGTNVHTQNSFLYVLLLYLVYILSRMKHFLLDIKFEKGDTL